MEENKQNQVSDYEIKRQQRMEEQQTVQRKKKIKRFIKISLSATLMVVPIGGLVWYAASRPPTLESDIVSKQGLHWHPQLSITIKGQKQEIPANIGIGAIHSPTHTHDASGVIHLEMQGLFTKDNIRLSQFFKTWGKQFNANCILDLCNGSGGTVKILVNGKENTEFENYQMKDKDEIEIKYE